MENNLTSSNNISTLYVFVLFMVMFLAAMAMIALDKMKKKNKIISLIRNFLGVLVLIIFIYFFAISFAILKFNLRDVAGLIIGFLIFLGIAIAPEPVINFFTKGRAKEFLISEQGTKTWKATGFFISMILLMGILIYFFRYGLGYENGFSEWFTQLCNQISLKLFGVVI
jgi:hypothetical protein